MSAECLISQFDQVTDTPAAIQRLRAFILDLAVRGRLVPQDSDDEPASDLLQRITRKREALVRARKIRKPRMLQGVDVPQFPFVLPSLWAWARIDSLSPQSLTDGDWIETKDQAEDGGVRLIQLADVGEGMFLDRSARFITEDTEARLNCTRLQVGDVLIARLPSPIGRACVFPDIGQPAITAVDVAILRLDRNIDTKYSVFALNAPTTRMQVEGYGKGATRFRVSTGHLRTILVPLPPLAEQRRIVARVEELMATCDQFEAASCEREAARNRFSMATLTRLSAPDPDPGTFRSHAEFAINNLMDLTARSDQVSSIRETIRNLAVRGKLVAQDACDEPVHTVLSNRGVVADTNPFPIPESWAWVCSGSVADCRLGKMLDRTKNEGVPRKYLRNVNVRWFDFDLSDLLEMRFEDSELVKFALRRGDVLMCEGGEPGRSAVWDGRQTDIYFQKAIHRVRLQNIVAPAFFVMSIRASADDGRLREYFTGTGIQHFTGRGLRAYSFPLPPLAEQRRIVAKVDELMDLCDRLEASLVTAEEARRRLLDALLREALEPAKRDEAASPARGHKSE